MFQELSDKVLLRMLSQLCPDGPGLLKVCSQVRSLATALPLRMHRWQVLDPATGVLDWQGQHCRLSTARVVRVLVSALCCQQQLAQNIQDTSCVAAVGPVGGRGRLDTESHQGMVKQPKHDNRDGPPAAAEAIQPSFFLLADVSCRFTHHTVSR